MQRVLSIVVLAGVSASASAGCKRQAAAAADCDVDAVARLADELDGMSRDRAAVAAATGLATACPGKPAPWVGAYLEQAAAIVRSDRAVDRHELGFRDVAHSRTHELDVAAVACPGLPTIAEAARRAPDPGRELYAGCELERYGLLEPDELGDSIPDAPLVWALHQWLLDQRVTGADARTVARALLDFERRLEDPGLRLYAIDLPRIAGGVALGRDVTSLEVVPTSIAWSSGEVATLDDGVGELGLDSPIRARLRESFALVIDNVDDPHARLAVDARVPFSTLTGLAGAALEAGFERYELITALDGFRYRSHAFVIRPFVPGTEPVPVLAVDVRGEQVLLRVVTPGVEPDPSGSSSARATIDGGELEAARQRLIAAHPDVDRLELGAAPDTPVGTLLAVYERVRGPACVENVGACWMTEAALSEAPVERLPARVPVPRRPADFSEPPGGLLARGPYFDPRYLSPGEVPFGLEPEAALGVLTVDGEPAPGWAERMLGRHGREAVRTCYAAQLAEDYALAGELTVVFDVTEGGVIMAFTVEGDTLGSAAVVECIRASAASWMPPEGRFVESRRMRLPLAFSARWGWFVTPPD